METGKNVLGAYAQALDDHYARNWSKPVDVLRWQVGPIQDLPHDFRVLAIERSNEMTAYATRCMSQPEDGDRLELHILTRTCRESDRSLLELLFAIAHYHRTGRPLGLGHTVNFGRPWLPGSCCCYGLISLPYLDGPKLEWLEEPKVQFLWLVPITEAELRFKKSHGVDELEERFEQAQVDYLDPLRRSVV